VGCLLVDLSRVLGALSEVIISRSCHLPPAQSLALMKLFLRSVQAGWERCIARGIRAWAAMLR